MAQSSKTYSKDEILKYALQRKSKIKKEFPSIGEDYIKLYAYIEEYLVKKVHNEILQGAILSGDGLLNDHGAEHVEMVIQRAGLILGDKINDLTGFEIFLLLLAIHFHDVGNIMGREKHEERIFEIMSQLGEALPLDTPTKKYIAQIAMAHGGSYNGNKDTISCLQESEYLHGIRIRPSLLASILRFSDEISDDFTRASRFILKNNQVPPGNKVFHEYSKCLQPAAVNGNTLILKYDLTRELAIKETSKLDSSTEHGWRQIFLYDEILNRLTKCLCELEYCKKYSYGFINLSSILADITVHKENRLNPIYHDSIRLRLSGYPTSIYTDITQLCENKPKVTSGEEMKKYLEKNEGSCVS